MSGEHKASAKTKILDWIKSVAKALTALVGIATGIAAMGVLPQPHATYVSIGIGIATAVLTYVIPNVQQIIEDNIPDPAGLTVDQIVKANPAPVEPAEAVESLTPTEDTPQPVGPDTEALSIEQILGELNA